METQFTTCNTCHIPIANIISFHNFLIKREQGFSI